MSTDSTSLASRDGRVRKYFRVVAVSADLRKLHQRDFEVKELFGTFVRVLVSNMITLGVLTEGLHYSALIIPRYTGTPRFKPQVIVETKPRKEVDGWLAMEFEEGPLPDQPVAYCTLEVRVKGMMVTCRQDFEFKLKQISLDHLIAKDEVFREQEAHSFELFAREDDESELRDKGYLSKAEADELVELAPEDEGQVTLPEKSLSQFEIEEVVGRMPEPDDLQIVIMRSAYEAVQTIARNGAQVEEGGVLVGNVFQVPSAATHLVEISAHILAEEARGTQFELRYTFESWQKRTAELKEKFPGRRVVGWYHTHLLKANVFDELEQQMTATEHFFSASDHFMHRQFFPEKWYVAMVLNPSGEAVFFQWDGNDIVRSAGFYVVKDEPLSPELSPESNDA